MSFLFETRSMKARRVKRALAGYPLFDPPFKQKPKLRSQTQENFDYFKRVRAARLGFFQQWLRAHFDIDASLDRNGTMAVNRWVDRYGGSLFDRGPEHTVEFSLYAREWTGSYTGYNVIIDVGIFVGEFVICKRPQTRWEPTQKAPVLVYDTRADAMSAFNVAWIAVKSADASRRSTF
jgi:hypothetical protein